MKKFLLVIALAAIIATGTVFADHPSGFGIGVQGGGVNGWTGGFNMGYDAALTLKLPGVPIFWTINIDGLGWGYLGITLAGDYYLIDKQLVSILHWYLGIGGYVNLVFIDPLVFGLGARLPIGLSLQPTEMLEFYLQVVPTIGVNIGSGSGTIGGGWGGNLGIRFWF